MEDTFDWYCIDLEHGLIEVNDINPIFNSLKIKNAPTLVRLNIKDINLAPKLFDLGIDGLIIANTNNENDLKKVISFSMYPPKGNRSIGFAKSNNFNFKQSDLKFSPILIPMIEKKEAVENLNDFKKHKEFDGFFIGPVDLSASYKKFKSGKTFLIEKIINKIHKEMKISKIPIGMHSISFQKNELKKFINKKYNFVAYSADSVILRNYYKF